MAPPTWEGTASAAEFEALAAGRKRDRSPSPVPQPSYGKRVAHDVSEDLKAGGVNYGLALGVLLHWLRTGEVSPPLPPSFLRLSSGVPRDVVFRLHLRRCDIPMTHRVKIVFGNVIEQVLEPVGMERPVSALMPGFLRSAIRRRGTRSMGCSRALAVVWRTACQTSGGSRTRSRSFSAR